MDSSEDGEIKFKQSTRLDKIHFTYKLEKKIGSGTFGDVFYGTSEESTRPLALKRIKLDTPGGISITIIREITILKSLKHENIIPLLDVSIDIKGKPFNRKNIYIYLVFPFFPQNLLYLNKKKAIGQKYKIPVANQILQGLAYLHRKGIFHRDLKSENILLDANFSVRIADFGLSKRIPHYGNSTPGLVTLWYRAPEILLGDTKYTSSIDMWSFGCILAELYTNKPIMPGETELQELEMIINLCGTINEKTCPSLASLPYGKNLRLPQGPNRIKYFCNSINADLICILPFLLNVDPTQRYTAEKALKSKFFAKQ